MTRASTVILGRVLLTTCAVAILPVAFAGSSKVAWAQELLLSLLEVNTMLASPPPDSAQEELPGYGHKFELFGAADDAQDPDNPTNDVISTTLNVSTAPFGGAIRRLPPGIKIAALDNQVNLKYRFTAPRTCGGGSPRISLFVDANGDGVFDQNAGDFVAQGHVNPPLYGGCPPDVWVIEDLTDFQKRWETTPLVPLVPTVCGPIGAVTTCRWDELQTRVTLTFPNHQVVAGGIVDDTFGQAGGTGTAHYDLITIENRTLENRNDTVRR